MAVFIQLICLAASPPRVRRVTEYLPAQGRRWSFRWSFRQARHHMTGPYALDELPDLTSEDDTLQDGMDDRGSTF